VSCKSCQSTNQRILPAEVVVHFPGTKDLHRPQVWVLPSLLVCFNCGFTDFVLAEEEIGKLVDNYTDESDRSYGT